MFYFRKKYHLKNVHSTFYMGGKSDISSDLVAGAYTYIGPNCIIYPKVSLGDYTLLANDVQIIGSDHNFRKSGVPITFSGRDELHPTVIGKDVWIGAGSKIAVGIKIGNGAIIAMGAVVTKDVEPFAIYAGIPAKKIRNRFDNIEDIRNHQKMLDIPFNDTKFDFTDLTKPL